MCEGAGRMCEGGCMKVLAAAAVVLSLGVAPARAVLGQRVDSVTSDQQHLRGELRSVDRQGYSVEEISSGDGTVVREYVSPNGMVFGIAWKGPTMPDLNQLLGSYFADFQQASQAQTTQRRRAPVAVRTERLVVELGGHMRAFHGRALVPGLVPNSVSEAVVQ